MRLAVLLVLSVFMCAGAVAKQDGGVKWHPGHYFIETNGHVPSVISRLQEKSEWSGAFVKVYWRQIEVSRGVYDWSLVDALIEAVELTGDKLGVNFGDRVWGSTCEITPVVPDDMIAWGQWPLRSDGTGCIARIHDPAVIERQIEVISAFMERYDANGSVIEIGMSETSVAFLKADPTYTDALLIAGYKDLHSAVGAVSDHTVFTQSMNFISGDDVTLGEIADVIEATGNGAIGTGDIETCAYDQTCTTRVRPGYVVIEDRQEELGISLGGEFTGIISSGIEGVLDLSVDVFGANIKGWKCNHPTIPNWCENELYPALDAAGWRIDEECPTTYASCGDGGSKPPKGGPSMSMVASASNVTTGEVVIVKASWEATPSADTYQVRYSVDGGVSTTSYGLVGPSRDLKVSIDDGEALTIQVRACNKSKCSEWSDPKEYVHEHKAPSRPSIVAATKR